MQKSPHYIYTESRFECKDMEVFLFYKSSVSWCFECMEVFLISFNFTNLDHGSTVNAGIASTYIHRIRCECKETEVILL